MFSTHTSRASRADTASYWLLLLVIALLPVCVLPFAMVSTVLAKIAVGSVLVLLSATLYAIGRIRLQEASLPKSLLLYALWGMPVVYALATFFSGNPAVTFGGEQLGIDTAGFMAVLAIAGTLSALLGKDMRRILGMYASLLVGAVVFIVAQLAVYLIDPGIISSVTLMGSLKDVAVFFGLAVISVLFALLLLPVTALLRAVLYAVLAGSLFFLAIANLPLMWYMFGFLAFGILVWQLSVGQQKKRHISGGAVLVLLVSVFFLFSGEFLSGSVARVFQVGELDVRPLWSTTMTVGGDALANNALFGVGPGRFTEAWAQHMPLEMQGTQFWNTDFAFGIGFIPTSVITTGIAGFLAWLIFYGAFVYSGVRAFLFQTRQQMHSPLDRYVGVTSFVGAGYIWGLLLFQNMSSVLILYAGILTGIFIAVRVLRGGVQHATVSFEEQPQVGFLVTLFSATFVVVALAGIYQVGQRVFAESAYRQAIVSAQEGDIETASAHVNDAIRLHPLDVYYRLKSTLDFAQIREIVRSPEETAETVRERMELLLSSSVEHARKATMQDPRDYRNWLAVATLYQNLIPFDISGAKEEAYSAFDRVLTLRPLSPSVYLAKATIERASGNTREARTLVEQAITIRNNYTDAVFLLAQMQLEAGETDDMFRSVQAVTIFDPRNHVAHFKLGLLHYWEGRFAEARVAFERAVAINGAYANARYFLGLTYWREGAYTQALQEMQAVLTTNPGNTEVMRHIDDISAGKPAPTANAQSDILEQNGVPVSEENSGDIIEGSILDGVL